VRFRLADARMTRCRRATATARVQAVFLECRGAAVVVLEAGAGRRRLVPAAGDRDAGGPVVAAGDLQDWWKSEAGEVGGQERDDLPDASVPDGEDVEAAGYELLSVVVPQVGAERELAVCRGRQEPPA
jgi:hypothetical protein